jgi:hypothetical protein
MDTLHDFQAAFHYFTEPFFELLTIEQKKRLAEMETDPRLAARVEELADKANEGTLSGAERAEYEAYIDANDLMTIMQAEARYRLEAGHGG